MTTPTTHVAFRDSLFPKFVSLLISSTKTHSACPWGWGFLLIRTAPFEKDESLDTLIWHTAITRLRHNGHDPPAPGSTDYDVLPDFISLPVMSDPSLTGLSPCDLRSRYNTWVDDFRRAYSTVDEYGHPIDGFEALGVSEDVMWNQCFLVVDGNLLRSLMTPPFGFHPSGSRGSHSNQKSNAPGKGQRTERKIDNPWVIVVDTTFPFDGSRSSSALSYNYNGDKAPYPGWMRCSASALEQLWNDIDMLDSFEEQIYPGRTYAGEIPLYTGALGGRCSRRWTSSEESQDGKGRYKFPVLPGRGRHDR